MGEPRRHHFLPAGYLGGFTEEGGRDGKLWVFDIKKKSWRPSKPENEAHRRDFYRIENHAGDPQELEKVLSEKLEGPALAVIGEIINQKTLPNSAASMEYLISFVGLLATRVPAHRKKINNFFATINKQILSITLATKDMFETTVKRMKASGVEVNEEVTYEQMQDFFKKDKYTISVDQDYLLDSMMKNATKITDLLYQRNWSLLIAPDEGEFICGENPVTLTWTDAVSHTIRSPGYGLKNTEVFVPIAKKFALLGTFNDQLSLELELKMEGIAILNSWMMKKTDRFIFSSKQEYVWMNDDGNIGNSNV